ncbi:MAG: lipase family protein [Formosimonas sp.]
MIDPATGFAACAYKNPQTNEVVIAYRGTDDRKDASPDAALARDSKAMLLTGPTVIFHSTGSDWHPQFTQALDFVERVKNNNPQSHINVTGHSLGGGLAQISAKMYGFEGVTFDPAGAQNVVNSKEFKSYAKNHNIPENGLGRSNEPHNYEVKWSAISGSTGAHVGRSTPLTGYMPDGSSVSSLNVATRHSMERIEGVFAVAAIKGELPEVAINEPQMETKTAVLTSIEVSKTAQTLISDSHNLINQHITDKGMQWNRLFDQAAHSVACAMHEKGANRVEFFNAENGRLHAMQRDGEFKIKACDLDSKVASNTPIEESLAKMTQIDQQRATIAQNNPSQNKDLDQDKKQSGPRMG